MPLLRLHLPANHVGTLVNVGNTIEEALNASEALSEVRFRVVSIVQILGHLV